MTHKTSTLKSLLFFIAFFSIVSFGFGQEIASFSSLQNSACSGIISNDVNLVATGICRSADIIETTAGNPPPVNYNSRNWTNGGSIDANYYLEWTLTPNSGYQIDLSTMDLKYDRSPNGPSMLDIQINTGLGFSSIFTDSAVDVDGENSNGIDLSSFTGITGTITFRLFAFSAANNIGTFDIEELIAATNKGIIINGAVSVLNSCLTVTAWNGTTWDNGNPDLTTIAVIDANYNTATSSIGSFSACSVIVNNGARLTISDNDYVEVQNDVLVDGGEIRVESRGALVQNDDLGTFTSINTGSSILVKTTRSYTDDGLHYVYWSSPVKNMIIETAFPDPYLGRRYYFDAAVFKDELPPFDIDDNNDDWRVASGPMEVGSGYVVATVPPPPFGWSPGDPYSDQGTFSGDFNTGDIPVPVFRDDSFLGDTNWNLTGNPYPSAISAEAFLLENYYDAALNPTGTLDGAIYLWTHNSAADAANPGNEVYNFSQDDYATMNITGGVYGAPLETAEAISANGAGPIPNGYIPSGQGFFASYADGSPSTNIGTIHEGEVRFTNVMRMADGTSNSQFFKNSNIKSKTSSSTNKLWLNLTSDNGVFNQVLIGYLNMASNNYDGDAFDAPKNLSAGAASILYTSIPDSDKKFAIQAKAENSLNENEIISLGFDTNIDVPTLYTLSIAQLQGDFLTNSTIYLKDTLLNKLHNLSESDYNFTSEVGEFNERFKVTFTDGSKGQKEGLPFMDGLKVVNLKNNRIKFIAPKNLSIENIAVFDLQGILLYNLKGNHNTEIYSFPNLKHAIHIVKITLSNGDIIVKKIIK